MLSLFLNLFIIPYKVACIEYFYVIYLYEMSFCLKLNFCMVLTSKNVLNCVLRAYITVVSVSLMLGKTLHSLPAAHAPFSFPCYKVPQ